MCIRDSPWEYGYPRCVMMAMTARLACSLLWIGPLFVSPLFVSLGAQAKGPEFSPREETPLDTLPAELPTKTPFGLPALPEGFAQRPAAWAVLGRKLFFDPILSRDRSVSCATCHDPAQGFADDQPFSVGVGGKRTERNSPTLFNRGFGASFMWDGRAKSLEEQVLMPCLLYTSPSPRDS